MSMRKCTASHSLRSSISVDESEGRMALQSHSDSQMQVESHQEEDKREMNNSKSSKVSKPNKMPQARIMQTPLKTDKKKKGITRKIPVKQIAPQKEQSLKIQVFSDESSQEEYRMSVQPSQQRSKSKFSGSKIKYKILSYQQKRIIVKEAQNDNTAIVAMKYGVSVTNIQRWRKRVQRKSGAGRKLIDEDMQEELLEWIIRQGKFSLTKKQIRKRALKITSNQQFKASKGWLQRFMTRNKQIKLFLKPKNCYCKIQYQEMSSQLSEEKPQKESQSQQQPQSYQPSREAIKKDELLVKLQEESCSKTEKVLNPQEIKAYGGPIIKQSQQKGSHLQEQMISQKSEVKQDISEQQEQSKSSSSHSLQDLRSFNDLSLECLKRDQSQLQYHMQDEQQPRMKTYQEIEKQSVSFFSSHPTFYHDLGLCLQSNNCIHHWNNNNMSMENRRKSRSPPNTSSNLSFQLKFETLSILKSSSQNQSPLANKQCQISQRN